MVGCFFETREGPSFWPLVGLSAVLDVVLESFCLSRHHFAVATVDHYQLGLSEARLISGLRPVFQQVVRAW
jgi:hypothetical protein